MSGPVQPEVGGRLPAREPSPVLTRLVAELAAGQGFPVRLGAGEATDPLRVPADELPALLVEALAGRGERRVVWVAAGNELFVDLPETRVEVLEGMLVAGLRVSCDQTGDADLSVVLAVGAEPTGLPLVVVSGVDGPPLLRLRWAEAAVAAASGALLRVVEALAAATGQTERRGGHHRPASLWAEQGRLLLTARTPYGWENVR